MSNNEILAGLKVIMTIPLVATEWLIFTAFIVVMLVVGVEFVFNKKIVISVEDREE